MQDGGMTVSLVRECRKAARLIAADPLRAFGGSAGG